MTLEHENVEILSPTVTRSYLYDGRISIYKLVGVSRETNDVWVNSVLAEMQACPLDQPYLSIQDMTQSGTSLYGSTQTRQLYLNAPPDLKIVFALIPPPSIVGRVMGQVAESFNKVRHDMSITYRVVSTYDEALLWLEPFLDV